MRYWLLVSAAAVLAACDDAPTAFDDDAQPTPGTLSLEKIGSYSGGGPAAAEITAFDPASRHLFIVNGAIGTVDVLDIANPAAPILVSSILVTQFGAGATSVAIHDGVAAVAIGATTRTDPGTVAFYNAASLELISRVTVGALPDMVTFTPSGRYVLVANEGEPNDAYTVDPEGSISVIDVRDLENPVARTAGFAAYNSQIATLRTSGVRIFGPNASVAQDLEPEYITVSADDATAYVTLQENNAMATVNIESATITAITPFGFKNHRKAGAALDVSDRDNPLVPGGPAVSIRNWPVLGMYQPDAIASYVVNGETYLVTANEGDARDWAGLREEARAGTLALDPAVFTDAACNGGPCSAASRLGRLTVTTQMGKNPMSGLYEALFTFGGRSFSIWKTSGERVWDSGDEFEIRTSTSAHAQFNASNTGNAMDDRSDNKGPEPEGIVLARFGAKTFAFIGLERTGGVMVYDISDPAAASFVTYASSRAGETGDQGPEGLTFIRATESPNAKPLLVVGNEASGTTAIFQIHLR